jgi:Derlin-2/3
MLMLMQSRTIAASAFTLSILTYTGYIPFYYVAFVPSAFVKLPPQLWRLVTSFLITGPKWGIIFDTYFRGCRNPPHTFTCS